MIKVRRSGLRQWLALMSVVGMIVLAASGCARESMSTGEAVDDSESISTADLEEIWSGKTIRFICNEEAGGSVDTTSRLIARHLGGHLPGNPRVVVENMPGGEGRTATNFIYSAKPDGLTIGMTDLNVPFYSLIGEGEDEGVLWDPEKINWLGSPAKAPQVLAVDGRLGLDASDLEAIRAAGLRIPFGAVGDGPHTAGAFINEVLDLNLTPIFGFGGFSDNMLALGRGEVDAVISTWDGLVRRQKVELEEGALVPVLQIGGQPIEHPLLNGVPTMQDLIAEDDQELLDLVVSSYEWARPLMAPLGIKSDVLKALREGVSATFEDPDFLAEAKQVSVDIDATSGEDVAKLVEDYLTIDSDAVDRLLRVVRAEGAG